MTEEEYNPHLKKRMETIHGRVCCNTLGASDPKMQRHDVSAEKRVYMTGDLVYCITLNNVMVTLPNFRMYGMDLTKLSLRSMPYLKDQGTTEWETSDSPHELISSL